MSSIPDPVNFLIVDDLPENLLSLEGLLRRDGLACLKARSGEEALELLLKHDVALALLDVQMPGMDGFELAEFMRGSERSRHVPIIFLTAGTTDTQRRFRGYEAGAVDFIQKPIEPDVLRGKAGVFFDLHQQRRQIQQQRDALEENARALAEAAGQLEAQVNARTVELEDALRRLTAETAERERAEATLRQSQKMEAVGQLTGGIAHDFNNMLTGVIGSLDLMRRRIASGRTDGLDRYMDAATLSAERAAALTHRLLAFSRRQTLDPKPVAVNELIQSMANLVERAIDEKVDFSLALAADLPPGMIDPNQLENAILNLAINARDAMPDGGALTIETTLADLDETHVATRPGLALGRYVVVAVSDTGVGMAPDLIQKVFEPFFTTKPLGQGTGLGLSMVYGFVRQSGGAVRIHSQPGLGTSVKLYLPITEAQPVAPLKTVSHAPDGCGQRVLVVEDDPAVRLLVREVLEELRYEPIEFADPLDAVPFLASEERVDLMISDVGLPGMNGRELAETARMHRPGLPILFITGYAENAAIRSGFLGTNMAMVTKPFSLDELAGRVNQLVTSSVKYAEV
ncbi:signal transduction histidine kinase [Sphingomonas naasensis]|uniref:histidine kinase n=1 Tax=Sphingomonas naasensis TaxID=1344951 RepID=A0A4S1WMB8_9SPHN|nr:response regulator [Sphingomonas naasensis]NIJ20306.1 signal transduction histidine kinase [Sphingomonas naasensis]TGX44428.1 hybrid sensor histidine kinase/response regulator [Sphingomonas naasensis]